MTLLRPRLISPFLYALWLVCHVLTLVFHDGPFQISQGKGALPAGAPPTQVNKLDNMLGSLQSDLNKLGVQTLAKGVCGACCKPIVGQVGATTARCRTCWIQPLLLLMGSNRNLAVSTREQEGRKCPCDPRCLVWVCVQVVTAMGRTWHPEHFVCTHCQEEIGSRNFFEREGRPYCEQDYHKLFSPRCYYCNGPILDVRAHQSLPPSACCGPSSHSNRCGCVCRCVCGRLRVFPESGYGAGADMASLALLLCSVWLFFWTRR